MPQRMNGTWRHHRQPCIRSHEFKVFGHLKIHLL